VKRLESVRQDFVSNVSHELRTPLSSLKALLETLKDGAIHDPRAAEHFLNQMDQETDNLIQMVEELLELSRIESGKVPLNICSVQPFELLKTALDRMKVQAQRADLRIKIKINSNSIIPSVQADPQRIELVLINLIHNAIKFTEPGGKILLDAKQEKNFVIFSVKDTGKGITPDDLNRIFERFYKSDRARATQGTGLGLSISRHIIESHNGKIWAESEIDKGSTFYFSLPLC